VPEDFAEAVGVGLFDVNGDGYPDRIHAAGSELHLSLWERNSRSFVENVSSRARVSNSTLTVRAIWDLDADGRLDILSSDSTGNVYCQELGFDTWNKLSSVPPMPISLRTNQWDNLDEWVGGSEGQALREQAREWMHQRGVVRPERMTGVYVPDARPGGPR
jgi:hypothetical protein